ncbi:uncharacterized protein B0P05DRAFT_326824 [Gilbertella persicaria]|uniref:uncharacterized protein n=1 Tax=Gilbertella persicaria TaxID=101096 RepID=UPI00221F44D5|nr:uncharacterized protein B0P05DRAFT_326824 [Gilbertella persicaria]KAI8090195.1 hypothetical protein B0P05DRAFT_326824 [Gilbertella persicaria]
MLPRLVRTITRSSSTASPRPLLQATVNYVKTKAPLVPALSTRAFSVQCAKYQSVETKKNVTIKSLDEYKNTGNLKGAIRAVQHAQEAGLATPALYIQLVDILRDVPFDVHACATVAHWFYSPESNLPAEVLHDINVWKSVLKLGFGFGSTYRAEDLRALVDRFTETFDLTELDDPTAWELLMRAYGILNKKEDIVACMANKKENTSPTFYASALLSFAATHAHEQVEALVNKLKEQNQLSRHTLLKLIRCYGFNGDVDHVVKYMNVCNQLYSDAPCDKTMLLIAHKVALDKICKRLEQTLGVRGLPLKPAYLPELDQLHDSWNTLTKDMLNQAMDVTDCNVVLEYLTIANRIDPVGYPIESAEAIFESYMPSHCIQPNDATHRIMLVGYATTQQYNDPHLNIRLNKALAMVSKMQVAGIDTLNHPTFHALFRACLPHHYGRYYFDNFRLNSLLPSRPYTHNRFRLDPRLFEIEKIMLEAKLPHDRFTFSTLMTCLATGGKYKAMRSRWRALKLHGIRRDVGLYRLVFALSSLHPTQAKRAIVVTRNEMMREIPENHVDWDTYVAMLDCCITAQLPTEAKEIIHDMRRATDLVHRTKKHADDLAKWPFVDAPNYYLPMLRAAVLLPGLDADAIQREIDSKQVLYSKGIWEALLSKAALASDKQAIQALFHKYTMSRFEKEGKIPIPVREAAKPVIPFPTAPYTALDMKFVDVYLSTLLDSQDISLVFDVLRTLTDQTDQIGISLSTLQGIVHLAKQEKSTQDIAWFKDHVLPKVSRQNKSFRAFVKSIETVS